MSLFKKLTDHINRCKYDYLSVLALLFLVSILFARNYRLGFVLSGWDNLHPEFMPVSYFLDKTLFGVWQEQYGLGAILSNANYVELFRLPFYFLLQVFVGTENVRFVWHFLMIL